MNLGDQTRAVLDLYPQVYFACHTRHVRDPSTQKAVSIRQVQVLDHLDRVDATAMNELARHLGVTASTVSLTVDRLEREGYVVRERDDRDGRRVSLRITERGERIREANSVLDASRVRALLGTLSSTERDRAMDGLSLLARAAARMRSESHAVSHLQE